MRLNAADPHDLASWVKKIENKAPRTALLLSLCCHRDKLGGERERQPDADTGCFLRFDKLVCP